MTTYLTLTERLKRVAEVSDLMLAGSVQVYMTPGYRPPKRKPMAVIHDRTRLAA